jgi:hypothetical protein
MSWDVAKELAIFGGLAGAAGAAVRFANPQRRRLGKCVLWELPSAALIGMAGYATAKGLFELNEYGRFLLGFAAGYLGHAAVHDLVMAILTTRARISHADAVELAERRSADAKAPAPSGKE